MDLHVSRIVPLLATVVVLALALPAVSEAAVLSPWGSNLQATPTSDTSNGDFSDTPTPTQTENAITPRAHDGADLAVWNTTATQGATAPQGGQILEIKVEGCAIEDSRSPTQQSSSGEGGTVPVNTINFQTLTKQSDGSYAINNTAPYFTLPFCSNTNTSGARPNISSGQVNATTITTYQPVHMCVNQGDYVDFEDVGGFIPSGTDGNTGGPWYDQGVPHNVIASSGASAMASFADAQNQSAYSPGSHPVGSNSGMGTEPGEELMLQVIEGTGDDAYGLCPGGDAQEPTASNTVTCVTERASAEGYPTCNGSGNPVYPAANTSLPTISGTAEQGQRLTASPGTWTNSPYGYSYQWEDCDSSGANCTAIAGKPATQAYYYPTASDVGQTLEVYVSASNDADTVGPVSSAPTAVVTAPPAPPPPPPPPAPAITLLKLNPSSFYAAKGSTITYTDNRAAITTLRVLAFKPGIKREGSCVRAPSKKPRHARKCTRMVTVRSFRHQDKAGGNGVKLSGLPPGRYELEVAATVTGPASSATTASVTAQTSRVLTARFTVKA